MNVAIAAVYPAGTDALAMNQRGRKVSANLSRQPYSTPLRQLTAGAESVHQQQVPGGTQIPQQAHAETGGRW